LLPVYKTEINDRGNSLRWPRNTLYQQKSALTSPTSGGRSVGIVRLRTTATELFFLGYSIQTGWNRCACRTHETDANIYKFLVGTVGEKLISLERPRLRCGDNTNTCLRETWCRNVGWSHIGPIQKRFPVNTVRNFRFPWKLENFRTEWESIIFCSKDLFR
jgi:hypothetical protein